MLAAEKLRIIAENIPKIYDAGARYIAYTTVTGKTLFIDDIQSDRHEVEVKLSSKSITDFSSVVLTVSKENLFDGELEFGSIHMNNGSNVEGKSSVRTVNYIPVEPNSNFKLIKYNNIKTFYRFYDKDKNYVGWIGARVESEQTFTTPANAYYLRFYFDTTDLNTKVVVAAAGEGEPTNYIVNSDGTVDGVMSLQPTMYLCTNSDDVTIKAKYQKYNKAWHEANEAGAKAEYDKFWDAYQENGNRTDYRCAFSYGWTDEAFTPKYDIVLNQTTNGTNSQQAFDACKINDIAACLNKNGVTIDTSQAEKLDSIFRTATTVSLPPLDLSNCIRLPMTFYNMQNLISIELNNLREDCVFDRAITFCYKLKDVRITGTIGTGTSGNNILDFQHSPLTRDSLLNIISCLKDFRQSTTFTVEVPTYTPTTITNGTLEEGKEYTWSYYDSMFPGWVTGDDATAAPSDEEVWITSTAGKVVVGGKEYVGFKANWLNYPTPDYSPFGVYVYQDGNEIKVYAASSGGSDYIKITLSEEAPITRTITFGATNLAKLTDAEKAVAKQKGWELK